MSCFAGILNEYKFLSIDRFDGVNLVSWAYFLSHCHTDHMVGLDSHELSDRFNAHAKIRLYCSEVTRALLLADDRYGHLIKYITTLPMEHAKIIDIQVGMGATFPLTVTLLPASHCPGSVMFLFEGAEGNALYTGDFRLPKGSAKRLRNLHASSDGSKKQIKSMYVDTTFCIPDAVFIPSREDCLRRLEHVVDEWLSKSESHAVRMNISAKYGYEYIFHALNKKFATKIYCRRKSLYQCLPDTYKIITDDPRESKIFACFKKERVNKPTQWNGVDGDEKLEGKRKFMVLTLSTLYFTYAAQPHEVCHQIGKNSFRFCFSFHSSYSEVCDFVKYIHPDNVYANVRPRNGVTLHEVEEKLAIDCSLGTQKKENMFKSFGKMKHPVFTMNKRRSSKKRALSLSSTDDEDSPKIPGNINTISPECSKRKSSAQNMKFNKLPSAMSEEECFDVSSSPDTEPPSKYDIDELYVKIALSKGLPHQ